jgi:hypothetical protein
MAQPLREFTYWEHVARVMPQKLFLQGDSSRHAITRIPRITCEFIAKPLQRRITAIPTHEPECDRGCLDYRFARMRFQLHHPNPTGNPICHRLVTPRQCDQERWQRWSELEFGRNESVPEWPSCVRTVRGNNSLDDFQN